MFFKNEPPSFGRFLSPGGEYFCRVKNALTHAKVEVIHENLNIIQHLPESLTNKLASYDFYTFEDELKLINLLSEQIYLHENDKLILFCETNRKPKDVQWFKNKLDISSESQQRLETYNIDSISILILSDDIVIEIFFQHNHNLLLKDNVILFKNNVPLYNDFEINPPIGTSSELIHWTISILDINLNDVGVYSIQMNQEPQNLFIMSIKPRPLQRKTIISPID
ncbi:unnamed protein product [Rotaria socialis]|uniref:Ig-like domain-containing protein n=1 Tax=Rotaria socialis TaxID=392032 RepID=A0A818ZED4_9BILA|nr:unnamed protein product [Rotaria socialis]